MEISIVIPFFNAYDFFQEAYESIKKQTCPAAEIIVVIDGCGQKAVDFLEQFDDLIVINLPVNQGPSVARNTGVNAAKSEWIAFLDADDKWEANKLERQCEYLTNNPLLSACHTGVNIFNKGEILSVYNNKPEILEIQDLLVTSHIVPTSFMIKKEVFDSINGFDTDMHCSEDHDFSMRLVEHGHKIGFLAEPLSYLRRENHGNISSNGRKILIGHFQLLKKHWKFYRQNKGTRSKFIYKTLISSGRRSKSIDMKLAYLFGRMMPLVFRNLNKPEA